MKLTGGRTAKAIYEDGSIVGHKMVSAPFEVQGDRENILRFSDELKKSLHSAPKPVIEGYLAELDALAPSRASDAISGRIKLGAYVVRLQEYPAGIVKEALLSYTWKFFPSWHELKLVLDVHLRERNALIAACAAQAPEEPEPTEARVTAEMAAEIMREIGIANRMERE